MRDFFLAFMFVSALFCAVSVLRRYTNIGRVAAWVVSILTCPILLMVLLTFLNFLAIFVLRGTAFDNLSTDTIYDASVFLLGLVCLMTGVSIVLTKPKNRAHGGDSAEGR